MEILQDWNSWDKELNAGITRRYYLEQAMRFLKTNVVVAITGARRAGKSYIMRQVIKNLIEDTDKHNTLLVNFEDTRFTEFYPGLLNEIYETYLEFIKPTKQPFIFLDEIHNVPKWERWVRTMHELRKAMVVISGSSSKLLSGELATVLTGRHLDLHIFPLSFKEFLYFRNIDVNDAQKLILKKIQIRQLLKEYFEFGGFPEVVLNEEKKRLLLTYFDDTLTKDIERRYKLKETETLRTLAKFYLTNIASSITFNSLRKFLNTTTNTIEKFSSYLEETGLIFLIKRFSFKVKEREKSPRKVYSIDTGISNAVGFRVISNFGKMAENVVATELLRRKNLNSALEIYYWKNIQHEEVDFVIKEKLRAKQLIQVCWDITDINTKAREIRSLLKASKELRCKDLLIVTEDKEGEEIIGRKKIKYIKLWKFLLEDRAGELKF